MGTARILGCTVEVRKHPQGQDVVYTVSGEGASKLHKLCTKFATGPTELRAGSFTITDSGLTDFFMLGDTPTVTAIREGLRKAAKDKHIGA
jgi:hypothetical protein